MSTSLPLARVRAGIEQRAGFRLARGGAAMRDDHVEFVLGAHAGADVEPGRQHLEIGLDGRGVGAGRTCGMIEPAADPAADAQRRVVDGDGNAGERKSAAHAVQLQRKLQLGAHGELLERARHVAGGPAAQDHAHARAYGDGAGRDCLADEVHGGACVDVADAGAGERVGEAVAVAERGIQLDARALGRFGERRDCVGRAHMRAAVGAERERAHHLGAILLEMRVGERRGARRREWRGSLARARWSRRRAADM